MKTNILILFAFLPFVFAACEKDTFHDSGLANGDHDCSLYEYLHGNQTFDSLTRLIERAGLVDLCNGKDPQYPEITLFAPGNLSFIQLFKKATDDDGELLYQSITDIPEDICREMVLSYMIPGKYKMDVFPYEVKGTLEGGKVYTTLSDLELRVYRTKGSWNNIPDAGADGIGIHFKKSGHITHVISCNITTNNAIVHALSTTFMVVNPVR